MSINMRCAMISSVTGVLLSAFAILSTGSAVEDQAFWNSVANSELEDALRVKWNEGRAKNVVLFVGDGMGPNTVTASRIYQSGERSLHSFERFPHVGLLKTYSVDKQVPDSASTATALFSGVKTNFETIGLDARASLGKCEPTTRANETHLDNIFGWAQSAGLRTGFVTTTRVTHATPAAVYAHCPDRRWECEAKIPAGVGGACKDIAWQLINNERGRRLNVIMGGGRQCLVSDSAGTADDPVDRWACYRKDGRDLISDWEKEKVANNRLYSIATNTGELDSVSTNSDYVLGIFANGHMSYESRRNKSSAGTPSLEQMTATALRTLRNGKSGFVLMVEGGLIDFAHHRGNARHALEETLAFNRAVDRTVRWLAEEKISSETLVIVTSDHTHGLLINGHPDRGENILGLAQKSKADGIPYTTLLYGTGGPNNYQFTKEEPIGLRRDPSLDDTTKAGYAQQAAVLTDEVKHGGGDVAIYAQGPMAHLFHSVHEQNYVAHVIAYSAKIGPYRDGNSAATILSTFNSIRALLLVLGLIVSVKTL